MMFEILLLGDVGKLVRRPGCYQSSEALAERGVGKLSVVSRQAKHNSWQDLRDRKEEEVR